MRPNVVVPVIVLSIVAIAWSFILGASLSFLGLGPRPPIHEWGIDLSNRRSYLLRAWWISSVPGVCIMLTVVAVTLWATPSGTSWTRAWGRWGTCERRPTMADRGLVTLGEAAGVSDRLSRHLHRVDVVGAVRR